MKQTCCVILFLLKMIPISDAIHAQNFIVLLYRIDLNKDKKIVVSEFKALSFDDAEIIRTGLKQIQGFSFDTMVQKYFQSTVKNSSDISVLINHLAVDDDGSGPSHGDRSHQREVDTRYRVLDSSGNMFLGAPNADEVPYIVRRGTLANGKSILSLVKKGDLGIILYNGIAVPVAAMDAKSSEGQPLTEASVKALKMLGHQPFPKAGSGVGLSGAIQVIMYPSSTKTGDSKFVYTQQNIEKEVRRLQYNRL